MSSGLISPSVLLWLGALSATTFVSTIAALPVLVARIPEDYFVNDHRPRWGWGRRHRGLYILFLAGKNLVGLLFVFAGIAMIFLPGQGVLTTFLGLTFMNFPGKRRLEKAIIRQAPVAKAANWMRARTGRPPLQTPGE